MVAAYPNMSEYRRYFLPGGTYFFTLVTYNRQPIFAKPENINLLRLALKQVKLEKSFDILAAVILPDHLHFIWQLPEGDNAYPVRIGRMKILFTQSYRGKNYLPTDVCFSRIRNRESNVWQRRYWEHTIGDGKDLENHLNYIHYNPVKHGLVSCPHLWEYSSFSKYVKEGIYSQDWYCNCGGRKIKIPIFADLNMGE